MLGRLRPPPALQIVWFRRDLRITDHKPLAEAATASGCLVPLYCFDVGELVPRVQDGVSIGVPKLGPHRAR